MRRLVVPLTIVTILVALYVALYFQAIHIVVGR